MAPAQNLPADNEAVITEILVPIYIDVDIVLAAILIDFIDYPNAYGDESYHYTDAGWNYNHHVSSFLYYCWIAETQMVRVYLRMANFPLHPPFYPVKPTNIELP